MTKSGYKLMEINEIPGGWEVVTLGNEKICEIIMGQSPPGTTYNEIGEGLPFFQGKAEFGDRYPSAVKWCSAPKKIARLNDVLMSVRAPVGPVNLCNLERCCIGRGLSAIRANSKLIHHLYLYHFLKLNEANISRMGQGSTFMAIGRNDIKSIKIPLPPLPTQRRIVEILEKADAVRKTRRIADEKTARILQAAFVKMFGNPATNPIGWEVAWLENLIALKNGKFKPTKYLSDEFSHPVYGGNGITGFYSEYHVKESTLAIGRVGVYCGAIHKTKPKSWVTDNAMYISFIDKKRLNLNYLFFALKSLNLNRFAKIAGQPSLSQGPILSLKIPLPPLELQQKFAKLVEKVEAMRGKQTKSREKIEETFQALMQKAFKGELVA